MRATAWRNRERLRASALALRPGRSRVAASALSGVVEFDVARDAEGVDVSVALR